MCRKLPQNSFTVEGYSHRWGLPAIDRCARLDRRGDKGLGEEMKHYWIKATTSDLVYAAPYRGAGSWAVRRQDAPGFDSKREACRVLRLVRHAFPETRFVLVSVRA